uniref:Dynein heavy chain tail domain-containing protein n=1 Tax=Strigops habroptila TaxID=2489341 RepID=A0A672UUF5_STRHB
EKCISQTLRAWTIVIEWSQQIRDILSKDSAEPLLEGLHPLPRAEFDFWHTRMVNLQCINDQVPPGAGSSCVPGAGPALPTLVTQPRLRSNEAPLPQLQPYLDRALCTVRLLRANCLHYSSPIRVVVILQEICNLLIDLVEPPPGDTSSSSGPHPQELTGHSSCTHSTGAWGARVGHQEEPGEMTVCAPQDLYQTAVEFLKLEKAELGGVKGNILGTQVFQIYEEVSEIIKVFADCKYDSLDPTEEVDFAEFQKKIEDIDRRLATIFCQGFDDCSCLMSAVKLVHMFSYLLERPVIKAELSPHYSALLEMFKAELEDVKVLYDTQISSPLPRGTGPAINKNMPPVAGQLKWALELQERLEGPYKDLFAIDHPYTLFAQNEMFQKFVDNLDLITGWYNEAGCKGEMTRLLFHALSTGQPETGWGASGGPGSWGGVGVQLARHQHPVSLPAL